MNGEKVHVCLEWCDDPKNPEWVIAGIVKDEKDAKMWVENSDKRKYVTKTIGIVENFYT